MNNFYSSDLHLTHGNIIRYCARPYYNSYEMDYDLTRLHNETLSPEDTWFFLGDFCMNQVAIVNNLPRLNFKKMYWILGNHDKKNKVIRYVEQIGLTEKVVLVEDMVHVIDGKEVFLTHRPINCSDTLPTICGHVHEKWKLLEPGVQVKEFSRQENKELIKMTKHRVLNVGVDVFDFKPVSEEQVKLLLFGDDNG